MKSKHCFCFSFLLQTDWLFFLVCSVENVHCQPLLHLYLHSRRQPESSIKASAPSIPGSQRRDVIGSAWVRCLPWPIIYVPVGVGRGEQNHRCVQLFCWPCGYRRGRDTLRTETLGKQQREGTSYMWFVQSHSSRKRHAESK